MNTKPDPFKVPHHYFDKLENEILAKTIARPKRRFTLWTSISIAASVLLMVGISVYLFNAKNSANSTEITSISKDLQLSSPKDVIETTGSQDISRLVLSSSDEIIKDLISESKVIEEKTIAITKASHSEAQMISYLEEEDLLMLDIEEDLLGDIEI
jgi:hypothetical protein